MHTLNGVFLASQPYPDDLRLAQCGGIVSVINLRDEQELEFDEGEIANRLGLIYHNVPFTDPTSLSDQVFAEARALLTDMSKRPVLLHCKSANRVAAVWMAHRVLDHGLAIEEAEAEATTIGLKNDEYGPIAKDYIERHRER